MGKRKRYIIVEEEHWPSNLPRKNAVDISALRAEVVEILRHMLDYILRRPDLLLGLSDSPIHSSHQKPRIQSPAGLHGIADAERNEFVLKDNMWSVRFNREAGLLKATTGAKYVAMLLDSPGSPLGVSQLLGIPQNEINALIGTNDRFFDDRGLAEVQARLSELQAVPRTTPADVEEIDAIEHWIRQGTYRGQSRNFRHAKNPVHAVRTAIRRFMNSLDGHQFPTFRQHLSQYVKTVHPFVYEPPQDFPRWNEP